MEVLNEQTKIFETQPAEAEDKVGENKDQVSLGKFKDVFALKSAYDSLQSEFTKRCQRIKELECEVEKFDKTKQQVPDFSSNDNGKELLSSITQQDKENILKDYLKEILNSKQKAIVMDGFGVGVKTPVNRPKTIEEAGKLASDIFSK